MTPAHELSSQRAATHLAIIYSGRLGRAFILHICVYTVLFCIGGLEFFFIRVTTGGGEALSSHFFSWFVTHSF